MLRAQIWMRGAVLLAAIWCLLLPLIVWVKKSHPTAAKTIAFVEAHPLESKPAGERMRIVEEFAERLNRLSFEERQNAQFDAAVRRYHEQMTEEERNRCWQLTLTMGMRQMIEAFTQMTPERRQQKLSRALAEMDRVMAGSKDPRFVLSDEDRNWIVNEGLMRYLNDADSETRLELQPFIERLQNMIQMAR